jgi:hypothetical protein
MSAGAAAASSAAAAAVIQAVKASGVIVTVRPEDFLALLDLNDEPVTVHAMGGFFSRTHQYLTSYRGLAFFAQSPVSLPIPDHCQLIEAKKIWVPG